MGMPEVEATAFVVVHLLRAESGAVDHIIKNLSSHFIACGLFARMEGKKLAATAEATDSLEIGAHFVESTVARFDTTTVSKPPSGSGSGTSAVVAT